MKREKKTTRRKFIKRSLMAAGAAVLASPADLLLKGCSRPELKKITILKTGLRFETEPLIRPFRFKGGYMKEIWQAISYMQSGSGTHSIGLGTQSVLWSDTQVFANHSESSGNALMYSLTDRALRLVSGQTFTSPVELLDNILPEVYEYGKKITSNPQLRKTFALNSLVGVDNAAWILFARENGITTFDEIIPEACKPALSHHHKKAAGIPLMDYTIPINEIKAATDQGYFFMKIKIGQPGTQEEMLEKDKERMTAIHQAIGYVKTPYIKNGKLPYYFDANGRYESKETLLRLLDHAKSIGAFEQIVIIEEPFAEELEIDVSDIPVRLASDESAHTVEDAVKRIEMGYKAMALKAIAKTLSMTMKIAQAAYERDIPCFCTDLTVNPVLVEWNKNVAARLASFPGIGNLGLVESNGHQNYQNWDRMMEYHPRRNAPWVKVNDGVYELGKDFYKTGGGIFDPMPHYEEMFRNQHSL
ncbi:MAG: twin-arginine translocation signal domain-containing protein [Bacteroidales bacterium]|nr:twin-arginine translocation signal domain-containing protein [Bacteroidales bacterium]